jgi:hypothetical protein
MGEEARYLVGVSTTKVYLPLFIRGTMSRSAIDCGGPSRMVIVCVMSVPHISVAKWDALDLEAAIDQAGVCAAALPWTCSGLDSSRAKDWDGSNGLIAYSISSVL